MYLTIAAHASDGWLHDLDAWLIFFDAGLKILAAPKASDEEDSLMEVSETGVF